MALTRRSYSGVAPATKLNGAINSATLSITVASTAGYPTGSGGPFFIVIDRGLSSEEKILVDSVSGSSFVVNASGRGYAAEGTTAASHLDQAVVEHVYTKTDADDANAHGADVARDDHTQYINNARHDLTGRHAFGAALGTPGTPTTVGPAAAAVGAGTVPARDNHVHTLAAVPSCVLTRTGMTNAGGQAVAWDTVILNTDTMYPGTGGTVTIKTAGWYSIVAQALWQGNATGYRQIDVVLTSGGFSQTNPAVGSAVAPYLNCSGLYHASVNNTIDVTVSSNAGVGLNLSAQLYVVFVAPY